LEVTVKLTRHAKQRMKDRFNHHPLTKKDIAEALRKGRICRIPGGFYVKHGDVGLILKSRLTAEADFHVTTVLNLKNARRRKTLTPFRKTPYKKVTVL